MVTETIDCLTSVSSGNLVASDWTTTSASGTNYYLAIIPDEPDEADVFKQIVSLLGIKIVNVSIKNGKVILYGKRNKKKFVIEIESNTLTVKGENGGVITVIRLYSDYSTGTITVTPAPYTQPTVSKEIFCV